MKKILICLLAAIALSNCEVRVKQSNAQSYYLSDVNAGHITYSYKEFKGMNYLITGLYKGGVTVTNLTKDSLEVVKLRRELSKD